MFIVELIIRIITTEAVIHIIFVIAHILCLIFGLVGLFVTIPLHIIVALMVGSGKKTDEQTELLKEQNEMLKKRLEESEEKAD
jgi:hypothetical protein